MDQKVVLSWVRSHSWISAYMVWVVLATSITLSGRADWEDWFVFGVLLPVGLGLLAWMVNRASDWVVYTTVKEASRRRRGWGRFFYRHSAFLHLLARYYLSMGVIALFQILMAYSITWWQVVFYGFLFPSAFWVVGTFISTVSKWLGRIRRRGITLMRWQR